METLRRKNLTDWLLITAKQEMDYQEIINEIYYSVKDIKDRGEVTSYIPRLSKVNSDNFGVHLSTIERNEFGVGNYTTKFSIQSISKVIALSLAYSMLGKKIWERVNVEPSGTKFNSLVQLETDKGIPRNPFINAGAIVICDILISNLKNPKEDFLSYIRNISSSPDINYNKFVAKSEKDAGYRNFALCYYIKSFDNIKNDPDDVLDLYFSICSIEMSCQELSRTFLFLADENFTTVENKNVLTLNQAIRINALMQTCGLYDESGEFCFKVGIPGKSGVGGGIVAVNPNKYCIAVWSPKLNKKGNSYKGVKFLEIFTRKTKSALF